MITCCAPDDASLTNRSSLPDPLAADADPAGSSTANASAAPQTALRPIVPMSPPIELMEVRASPWPSRAAKGGANCFSRNHLRRYRFGDIAGAAGDVPAWDTQIADAIRQTFAGQRLKASFAKWNIARA